MYTLAMMIKNEAASIAASIRSCAAFATRVVLLDTGSTDDTLRVARDVCDELGLPLEVYFEPFIDFATSRNRALELAEPTNPLVLMLSGDETVLNGELLRVRGPAFAAETVGGYLLPVVMGTSRFGSLRLFRSSAKARFVGPVHEYVNLVDPNRGKIDDVVVHHDMRGRDQVRAKARFRDIDLPLLLTEVEKPGCDPRWVFYLAQTYACLGELDDALRWYRKRVEVGGWHEETYEAQFRVARLLKDHGEQVEAYEKAHALSPHRAEPLVELAELFRDRDWPRSFRYALEAYQKPQPSDVLFVDTDVYLWRAAAVLGIAAWYTGDHEVGREATRKALRQRPDIAYLRNNMALYDAEIDLFGADAPNADASRFDGRHGAFFVQKTAVSRDLEGQTRLDVFTRLCRGKRVLHVGCVDWPITDATTSLHVAIDRVCLSLDGVDTQPSDALRPYVRGELFTSLEQATGTYDVVLVPEVLEHVDDMRGFLQALERIDATHFVFTVPDAQAANFERTAHGVAEVVHPDHRCWFSPHTIRMIVEKNTGLDVRRLFSFNNISVMLTATKGRAVARLSRAVTEETAEVALLGVLRGGLSGVVATSPETFRDARALEAAAQGRRGSIPRVIHQLWIGPKPAPMSFIETWRAQNPSCQHILWDEARLAEHLSPEQIAHAMTCAEINGQADVLRYHILAKFGGVFIDADAACLRPLPEELFLRGAWTCYEDEVVRPGLLAAGYMAAEPGHPVMIALSRRCAEMDLRAMQTTMRAWQYVGPQLLTNVAARFEGTADALSVLPARCFIGTHYSGAKSPGLWPQYATQAWGATFGYDRLRAATP